MDLPAVGDLMMPVTYAKLLLREHPERARLLAGTTLGDVEAIDDLDMIPVADNLQIMRNITAVSDRRDWHLAWARRMADHFHGPLRFALMSAPTLGAGVDAWARFVAMRVPYFEISLRAIADRCRCEMRETVALADCRASLVEIPLLVLHDYARTLGATGAHLARLDLAYPRPKDAPYHQRWFSCPVRFGAGSHAFEFPGSWRDLRNPAHDESTWRSSLAKCELLAAQMGERDLVSSTRAIIAATLEDAPATLDLDRAARRLHVSSRTLIRHLKEAGLSFQMLRDEAFKQKAVELLARPGLSIQDIAERLGYSDPANFGRAFRRWYGTSPGAYRKTIGR